jgi:hypothetical protein
LSRLSFGAGSGVVSHGIGVSVIGPGARTRLCGARVADFGVTDLQLVTG